MDATILHVMESWPLQLALETSAGSEQLALANGARILRAGEPIDPGELKPGLRVRVLSRTAAGEIAELLVLE